MQMKGNELRNRVFHKYQISCVNACTNNVCMKHDKWGWVLCVNETSWYTQGTPIMEPLQYPVYAMKRRDENACWPPGINAPYLRLCEIGLSVLKCQWLGKLCAMRMLQLVQSLFQLHRTSREKRHLRILQGESVLDDFSLQGLSEKNKTKQKQEEPSFTAGTRQTVAGFVVYRRTYRGLYFISDNVHLIFWNVMTGYGPHFSLDSLAHIIMCLERIARGNGMDFFTSNITYNISCFFHKLKFSSTKYLLRWVCILMQPGWCRLHGPSPALPLTVFQYEKMAWYFAWFPALHHKTFFFPPTKCDD